MAYQNVGTPRFYIDYLTYWKSIGFIEEEILTGTGQLNSDPTRNSFLGLDPTTPVIIDKDESETAKVFGVKIYFKGHIHYKEIETDQSNGFVAFLGHNLNKKPEYHSGNQATPWGDYLTVRANWDSPDMDYSQIEASYGVGNVAADVSSPDSYVGWQAVNNSSFEGVNYIKTESDEDIGNIFPGSGFHHHENSGFSIYRTATSTSRPYTLLNFWKTDFHYYDDGGSSNANQHPFVWNGNLNSVSAGKLYDVPHSPELDLTMTIENDGFDSITTQGGSHLTNIRYNGAPMWNIGGVDVPPWTIGEPTAVGRRRGRRVWSLNFKHLAGKDLFMANYSSGMYRETSANIDADEFQSNYNGEEIFAQNLNNDDSFFGRVLNYVGNGCRFIFQPDNTNFNPDQFAICQLDQDSLDIKQVANGVYDISLKIREVW